MIGWDQYVAHYANEYPQFYDEPCFVLKPEGKILFSKSLASGNNVILVDQSQ